MRCVLWKVLGAMFILYLSMACASALTTQPEERQGEDGLLRLPRACQQLAWGRQVFIPGAFASIKKTRCDCQRERVWEAKWVERVKDVVTEGK